ncbi:Wzz/FepE/Etk N-terminal domain-containing protein [Streptosporangium sp. NPDC006007]|uniref:YveK family protein n=1 Tax=Streptosporangium sp. NPDC006007 TaxID=3154575 RepID=UPI0033AB8DC2
MSPSPDARVRRPGGEPADYASLLRRRWPTILTLLVAGVGGGAALIWATPAAYTASAQVLVTPTGLQEQTNQVTNRQREPLNLDTEAQIAQSAVVARKVQAALKSPPGPVEVSVPPNTSVLEISYTAADPNLAAAGAGAYARAYLANRGEAATHALNLQLRALLTKLRQVNASLTTVVATLPGLAAGTAERTMAVQRQSVLSRQAYHLTVTYDALKTIPVTPGSVISDAVAPDRPSAPSLPLHLGSGLMAGLLAGVGLASLRDRLDGGRREAPGVRRMTGLDVPGTRVPGLDVPGAREARRMGPEGGRGGENRDGEAGGEGAVLLVSVSETSPRAVARAVRRLKRRGIPVIGALVDPPDRASSADETVFRR